MFRRQWIPWLGAAFLAILVLAVSAAGCSTQAAYPKKAIEVVVAWAAGGGVDTATRVIAKHLSAELGVPINITNKGGGNQIPGVMSVLSAPADGYTLLAEHPSGSSLHGVIPDLPYKMEDRAFGPFFADGPSAFVVGGKSPWNSLKDVVEAAKKDPGSFTWTRMGGISATDFAIMSVLIAGGVDIAKTKPVSFTGSGPGITAVAGGHVAFGSSGIGAILPLVSSGDLKVVAVNGLKRMPVLPNVPFAKEAGIEVSFVSFYGFSGPKDLPKPIHDRLDAAAKKITADPAFKKDVDAAGLDVRYSSPADARERVLSDVKIFKELAAKFPALLK